MPVLDEKVRTTDVTVLHASCSGETAVPEVGIGYELVRVRRGMFRREIDEGVAVVDATVAYVSRPGQVQQIHHVHGQGDASHIVAFSSRLLGDDVERLPDVPVRLPVTAELALRGLAARARDGVDGLAVDECAATVVGALIDCVLRPPRSPAVASARAGAVDTVREVLAVEVATGSGQSSLSELARTVGYAPHHLSRIFADRTGTTISRHRRSLRVHLAVSRIEEGALDLAALAADLGFADHSHLVRALRAELGVTPSQLRRALAPTPR
ncbi:MAG TPA: AraC family transcriptional regulator [Acidimicrobiia bacterium]|nr:AraC family transcriptional regulator [Acidimicrobiia bacterium]